MQAPNRGKATLTLNLIFDLEDDLKYANKWVNHVDHVLKHGNRHQNHPNRFRNCTDLVKLSLEGLDPGSRRFSTGVGILGSVDQKPQL